MRLQGRCTYCGNSCEWIRHDASGVLEPDYPCASSPSGHCEPETPGDAMVRRIASRTERIGSQRARGFVHRGKRR